MSDVQACLEGAVAAINAPSGNLYDVTIICTTDDHQAEYWMAKLSEGVCKKPADSGDAKFPMVLAVSEDWSDGGAGNGLGTLYAFTKASKLAAEKHDVDLAALLEAKKISAALFHTAGKGTRLAPLPASESNNKPGNSSFPNPGPLLWLTSGLFSLTFSFNDRRLVWRPFCPFSKPACSDCDAHSSFHFSKASIL